MATTQTNVEYLSRSELYTKEKPFLVNFAVPKGARNTNHVFEARSVAVEDGRDQPFELDVNGFTFIKHQTALQPDDFYDPSIVKSSYVKELEHLVQEHFPKYTDIVFLDFEVRKRDTDFPVDELYKYPNAQPLRAAHVDMTSLGARMKLGLLPPEQVAWLAQRDFEVLTIWRLLRGPTPDWPLAVLDYQSLDVSRDAVRNDNVFIDAPSENFLLHHNECHRWVYLKDQMPDEIYVFRNTCSTDPPLPFSFHCAFDTGIVNKEMVRESIEFRVAVFTRPLVGHEET